ncbi:hypothetical protein TNCV_1099531 [Trichonephila clavipes]|nr:hypothetical protein TNCV_1099531 [Trichonephila clavipes]
MGHEDELTTEELQEILNEEHQETQRNVSPSEQEEDERSPERINRFHIAVYGESIDDRLTNNSDSEHSLGTDYVR